MRKSTSTLIRRAAVVAGILLPVAVVWAYRSYTALPKRVLLAGGAEGGVYRQLSEAIADELALRHGVRARVLPSGGSLDNLTLLRQGKVDLALYEPGATLVSSGAEERTRFVATLYSQAVLVVVRSEAALTTPADLIGARVSLGPEASGDSVVGSLVLAWYGVVPDSIEVQRLPYDELREAFDAGTVDAAVLSVGESAPILRDLLASGLCRPLDLPFAEGLARRHLFLEPRTIPAGTWAVHPAPAPAQDVHTVATLAQLLASRDANASLVEAVTEIVHDRGFQRRNGLSELFDLGDAFLRTRPEFPYHPGALHHYQPELQPLLDPDFVEATEGMRSFVVSLLVAAFLAWRWWRRREERRSEHRLDRYIHALLEIERRQVDLDRDGRRDDVGALQEHLAAVTHLRQEALSEFSAHQLREDPGIDCFIEMCHALSNKINAKISRQRAARDVAELKALLRGADGAGGGPREA